MGQRSPTETPLADFVSRQTAARNRRLTELAGVHDPADPFNNDARPNEWTPPLNTSWRWGVDRVYGVNLGGWLVMEPFISPEIFQRYPGVRDEFSLSQAMAADAANGGLSQIEEHYQTFIVRANQCCELFQLFNLLPSDGSRHRRNCW